MPKVYKNNGLTIMVYYNDHEPMHVHVEYKDIAAKVVFVETRWVIQYHRHQKKRFSSKMGKAVVQQVRNLHIVIQHFWSKRDHDKK